MKKIYLQKKKRYRKKIIGTNIKPRLSIFRSNNHIYAQLINDILGCTLLSISSLDKNTNFKNKSQLEIANLIGQKLARKSLLKGINSISFDKNKYTFKGKIKSLIEGLRKPIFLEYKIFDNLRNKIIIKKLNF